MGKTLITGAGGFIGSHLVENCVGIGFDVKVFLHYNSKNSWGWLEGSSTRNNIEVVMGDIRDYDSVRAATKDCESVFHLAALIGIPYSYVSPLAYIKTNVEGTYNVLQASREHSVSNVIITSTSETYGTAQSVPIDEGHPLVGQSPYSATKIAADQLAISYFRSFGTPVKIVRPFNTYGDRQSARAVIPTIISQIIAGNQRLRLGNLSPTRDLTFVSDTVKAFIEISKSPNLFGEVTNVGMNEEISVENLARLIAKLMDKEIIIESDSQRERPVDSEVQRLRCNNSKLLKNTNWKADFNLVGGLTRTITWIEQHWEMYKPHLYNV